MNILVCGGRNYSNKKAVFTTLSSYTTPNANPSGKLIIIHGGASGADSLASDFAKAFGLEERVYPADWDVHGRAAGPIRNKQMLDENDVDLVVAFPGGKGTKNMIEQAFAKGVPILRIKPGSDAEKIWVKVPVNPTLMRP